MPPDPPDPADATRHLLAAANGDREAVDRLLPLVYEQLRRAAQARIAAEAAGHTLSATALVHEVYLRLVGPRDLPWGGRAHFYAAAAEAMRRVLLDHARARGRRGGKRLRLGEIPDVACLASMGAEEILAVDEAIERLALEDERAVELVRLRFYAGLSVDEAAQAMGLSPRSTARLWTYARALLYRDLTDHS